MHSTYAVVLSTRDPNIPCTTVPRQLPLGSCDFSPTLYTFDTVVARPARVLRCVEREARGTRATTRYNKAKAPRVARVSVSMHTQRSLTSGHLHAQDEDAACCSQGRRVNYERFTICRRAEFVKIAITEDAKMRTLCKKLRNKNGAKKTLHFPSGLILPFRTSTVPVASKQTPAAPLFRLLRAQIPKSASHLRHIPFPPPCASSWRGAVTFHSPLALRLRTGPSHWCTPRSRRDRLCEVGGSKLRWAAALQSLTRSAARRSQPPVVALAGEKKKDGVVPWTLDRTDKALRRSHVAAAVTLKASSTTRATVRPRPEGVDTAEATQEAARHAGQAAREMRSGVRRARLFRRSCADVSSSLLHSGLSGAQLPLDTFLRTR